MTYYIRIRGKAFGPFDEKQLEDMKAQGKLGKTTEVSENKVDWQVAESFDFLYPPPPPPPPPSRSSDAASSSADSVYETQPRSGTSPWDSTEWYYSVNGTEGYGPVTSTEIEQMLQSGQLDGSSYVWQQGQNARFIKNEPRFSGAGGSAPNPTSSPDAENQAKEHRADLFCAACGNAVVATAQMCPRCGSPIVRHKQGTLGQGFVDGLRDLPGPIGNAGIGYIDILTQKYTLFDGRASRKEFWPFMVINELIFLLFSLLAFYLYFRGAASMSLEVFLFAQKVSMVLGLISFVYWLFILIPCLALGCRRLHDTGCSGWLQLLWLIPLFGWLVLLILYLQDSQPGDNQYGRNPRTRY